MQNHTALLGLHHITAIASDPQANLAFYTQVLGLRFVKKSVNQDDPGTYHLYYGDNVGSPGTALTFFPWRGLRRGRPGTGQAYATAFSAPVEALDFWTRRLADRKVTTFALETRFGEKVLPFADPDGLRLEIIFTAEADPRSPAPAADVPAEFGLRGFHGSTLALADASATAALLTESMGYRLDRREGHRARYTTAAGGPGTYVELLTDPALPRGLNGAGTVHHIAFRVATDADQVAAHDLLAGAGLGVSPVIDRAYFKSIYYREPAGVLFEIATDQPGFAIDEPVASLGTKLSLPPRLEPHRAEIEALLPPLNP